MPASVEIDRAANSWLDIFVEIACPYIRIVTLIFSMLFVFTLVSLASVIALSPPNTSYYVALLTIGMNTPLILILGAVIYLCRQYNTQY